MGEEELEGLKRELKELVISALELEDVKSEDIKDDEPLFGTGLGLDSIDALELGVALKKKYGVKFSSDDEETQSHFACINALASYVASSRSEL